MIDVMLVLLIIFMIVTPLIASGFKATMPKGANLTPSPEGEGEVVLGIDEVGGYYVNGMAVRAEVLEAQLASIYAARPDDKILYFRADQRLKFAKIQEAVEIARRSGIRVMAAVTEKTASGGLFDQKEE
jgi:biopolymer transport protein ExbD/biopolymer transport protein TolR